MAFSEKLGRGSLGKSRKTFKGGAGPEYFGSLNIEGPIAAGEKVWLAGWVKESDNGEKFFSLVVERPPQQQREVPRQSNSNISSGRPSRNENIDDDIPF